MAEPKQPGVSVRLRVTRDAADDDKRYSTRPYAGTFFTEGRVRKGGWGVINRELSDDNGQSRMSTASVLINDDDGVIREALAEDETRFIAETEADLTILSQAGRAAALAERSLMRCRVEDAAVEIERNGQQRARSVRLDLVDALAPYYDQTIPRHVFLRSDFPDIDRKLEGTPIPLIYGEHSDAGAEDVNGNSAEKGLIPAIYVGGRRTVDDDPLSGTASFLDVPTGLAATVNGTPGTSNLYYAVTARSAVGETLASATLVVSTAPAVLNGTDSIDLTWDEVPDATDYVVYGRRNPTPARRLAIVTGGSPLSWTDDGTAPEYAPGPPATNTAQVEIGSPAEGGFFWDFYVLCLGVVNIEKIFGSNVAEGVEPARIDITNTAGVDILIPGGTGWPLSQNYIELESGLRVTGFFARGPRSYQHIQGIVTMAVQTCGYEDVGDGTGDDIQQAFYQLQHLLNEHVLKDGGIGYKTSDWGPLETWNDGSPATPMLQTSRFEACQDLTKAWLGNAVGYKGAIYLREPITVRQFLQDWFTTFDAFGAVNHHGQWYPVLYDSAADPGDGTHYRERIEILSIENPQLDKSHVEPRIRYQFDYDPDAGAFRSEIIPVGTAPSTSDREPGVKLLRFTRDADTAQDAMERRVSRLQKRRWRQTIVTKYKGLEEELGDQIRVTHADGPTADGWVNRPFFVVGHSVDANRGEVRLTGFDLYSLLGGSP